MAISFTARELDVMAVLWRQGSGTAMLRRSTATTTAAVARVPSAQSVEARRTFESVRALAGDGSGGGAGGGRRVPAAGTAGGAGVGRPRSGGVGDFGAFGFPNITTDAVMSAQSVQSLTPSALSVFVIRLKK